MRVRAQTADMQCPVLSLLQIHVPMIRDLSSTLSLCTEYLTRVAVQLEVRKRAEANRRNERIEALFQMIATLKRNKLKESRYVVHECTHTHTCTITHTHTERSYCMSRACGLTYRPCTH